MTSRRLALGVLLGALVMLAGCGGDRGVAITSAWADGPGASAVGVTIDACWLKPMPAVRVRETTTQINLLVPLKIPDGDSKACASAALAPLASPIGGRVVIDDRTGKQVPIRYPVAPPAPIAGSVGEVLGKEAPATVTGWLVIANDASAVMCGTLTAGGTSCASPTISVDWSSGGATPPTNLEPHGTSQVSSTAMTFSGSLKDNTLFVGVS